MPLTNSLPTSAPERAAGAPALPWHAGTRPLMLAPMQGLTNRALRAYFINSVRPDVVFTEFMRVNPVAAVERLSAADRREVAAAEEGVPLVVQLVGHGREALASAARAAQEAGAVHINLNMGCPYGRMTSGLTGGGMLRRPADLKASSLTTVTVNGGQSWWVYLTVAALALSLLEWGLHQRRWIS